MTTTKPKIDHLLVIIVVIVCGVRSPYRSRRHRLVIVAGQQPIRWFVGRRMTADSR